LNSSSYKNLSYLLIIFIWTIFLFLCVRTLQGYYLPTTTPFWDNLVYQIESIRIFRLWADGEWQRLIASISNSMAPAHVLTLAIGNLIFGLNSSSPYMISAVFGYGCLIVTYILSMELGAKKNYALWGVLFFSISPNFLYQNFLQSRNDFQLAFFICLVWILLLQGVKLKSRKRFFMAGFFSGVGALFKASAPGYIIFGALILFITPNKYTNLTLKARVKFLAYFLVGGVISCGWHYFPRLTDIVHYYSLWGDAEIWKISQYSLKSNWLDYLYYPVNLIYVHIGIHHFQLLIVVNIILLIRWLRVRKKNNYADDWIPTIWSIGFVVFSIFFITIMQSYASVGDIPVLPIFIAIILATMSRISNGLNINPFLLGTTLMLGLAFSLPQMPIAERNFVGKDSEIFFNEITKFRKEYGLFDSPLMQVYSHPIYNIDTYKWKLLINSAGINSIPGESSVNLTDLLFPEVPKLIAKKLANFPMLITTDFSVIKLGGESFHTFNRLQGEINSYLDKNEDFIKLRSITIEEGKFPVNFLINKKYSVIKPKKMTRDNWIEWGSELEVFSISGSKFIWSGITTRSVSKFRIKELGGNNLIIKFHYVGLKENGVPYYESQFIPGSDKIRNFILLTEDGIEFESASKQDARKLAFYKVGIDPLLK
jgi:hypothetical protein